MTGPALFGGVERKTSAPPIKPSLLHLLEATSAGAARFVCDVLLNIDLASFDVSFAYSLERSDQRFHQDLRDIEARGVTTYEIPMVRRISPVSDGNAFLELRRLLQRRNFDLIHTHSSKAGFLGRLAARSVRRQIVTVYSPHAIAISLHPAYGYLERFAGLFTDAIVGVSRSEHKELESYRLVPNRSVHHVTAAIDVRRYLVDQTAVDHRERWSLPSGAILVGTAGRLSAQKDPFTFLEVAKAVIDRNPLAYFVWIGDGELREPLEQRIRAAGIGDRMMLLGYRPDIRPLLSSLDVFLLTSRYESFGYVTCEAMALQKPVVATCVSGSNELVAHEETGFLAPPGDLAALVKYTLCLVESQSLRGRMGTAGRRRVEQLFDLPRMIRDMEGLYWKLLRPQAAPVLSTANVREGA